MNQAGLAERIGRRGAALLILAFVDFGVGWSFIDPTPEAAAAQNAVWREHFAPSWFWGGLWIAVGAVCLVSALARGTDTAGFMCAVGLKILWSSLEGTGWLAGAINQGYRPALIWLGFACFIFVVAGMAERHPPPAAATTAPGGGTVRQ